MTQARKTVKEIIEMVASTYTLHNRSMLGAMCAYNGANGKHCAFAMMVKDPLILIPYEGLGADDILNRKKSQDFLKDEFKGYTNQFYADIQWLHDNRDNWNDKGLTEQGRIYADLIISKAYEYEPNYKYGQ